MKFLNGILALSTATALAAPPASKQTTKDLSLVAGSQPPAPAVAAAAEPLVQDMPKDPSSPTELKKYDGGRYEPLIRKSPFAFEIFGQQGPPAASPFADWKLAGFTIDEGRGIVYGTLFNEKSSETQVINNLEAHRSSGIQLVQLEKAEKWTESKVRVRKGAEEEVLEFSKKALERKATVAAPTVQPKQGQPGMANNPAAQAAAANRANAVQNQINAQLNVTPPNPNQPQPNPANPSNAQPAAPGVVAPAANAQTNTQQQQPQRRRVILPPPPVSAPPTNQ
ncbi:MAG: hypothetical protein ACR2OZ_04280 [Verrucomicrobiales bacterium]